MSPEDAQLIMQRLEVLERWKMNFERPDRYSFWKNIQLYDNHRIIGGIYGGQVSSTGSSVTLPTGWTSTKTATGKYKVTHNLNTTQYTVVAIGGTAADTADIFSAINANYFEVSTLALGVLADSNFYFILMLV